MKKLKKEGRGTNEKAGKVDVEIKRVSQGLMATRKERKQLSLGPGNLNHVTTCKHLHRRRRIWG